MWFPSDASCLIQRNVRWLHHIKIRLCYINGDSCTKGALEYLQGVCSKFFFNDCYDKQKSRNSPFYPYESLQNVLILFLYLFATPAGVEQKFSNCKPSGGSSLEKKNIALVRDAVIPYQKTTSKSDLLQTKHFLRSVSSEKKHPREHAQKRVKSSNQRLCERRELERASHTSVILLFRIKQNKTKKQTPQ